jgi:hypothetical protein
MHVDIFLNSSTYENNTCFCQVYSEQLTVKTLEQQVILQYSAAVHNSRHWMLHCTPYNHLLLDSAPNRGPLISHWEIYKFENLLIQKCQDFRGSKAFVSAIFEFVMFPTGCDWSNIRRPIQ